MIGTPEERGIVELGGKVGYDVIVCGAGSAGSVVAGRLAEDPQIRVLLLEAGGTDEVAAVRDPTLWVTNLGSERDWGYMTQPNLGLLGRPLFYSMGKVLGGGSSINVTVWSRGHRTDWDSYAALSGSKGWGYESVLDVYRRVEDWHGAPDAGRRGSGGPMYVGPAQDEHPFFSAYLASAEAAGLARYDSPNGVLAEDGPGCAPRDTIVHDGLRQSVYQSFVRSAQPRENLTVVTGALVTKVLVEHGRATGVEVMVDGRATTVRADGEVVLSLGAVQTPKVLLQSGIGPADSLREVGVPVVQDLAGVGENLDDHPLWPCTWAATSSTALPPAPEVEAVAFWGEDGAPDAPRFLMYPTAFPLMAPDSAFVTAEAKAAYPSPEASFTFLLAMRQRSRGSVRLSGPAPSDPVLIETGYFTDPDDVREAVEGVRMAREIGAAKPLGAFRAGSAAPASLPDDEVAEYVRRTATTFWHQCGTAKMGQGEDAVVDGDLRVYGVERLRVADASVLPHVTSGNTMAPSVVIGQRAADLIAAG